jgi:TatD family hydrolase
MNEQEKKNGIHIEPFSLLKDIILNLWVVILAALIGAMSVYLWNHSMHTPMYTSTATLIVNVKNSASYSYTNLSASSEMAKIYTDMGVYLGIGGVVTFKNARKLKEVVKQMPMELMLLETDCPYLAPEPFRGKRNDSTLINYAAKAIAELRGMNYKEVVEITAGNARRFYRL